MGDEDEIETSPRSTRVSQDLQSVDIVIFRGQGDPGWVLEIVDQGGGVTVWRQMFSTDEAALAAAMNTIAREGIGAFDCSKDSSLMPDSNQDGPDAGRDDMSRQDGGCNARRDPGSSIGRQDLAAAVYRATGIRSRTEARMMVEAFLDELVEAVIREEVVSLYGFGVFKVRRKVERQGRNPKNGAPHPISARRTLTFRPSPLLQKATDQEARCAAPEPDPGIRNLIHGAVEECAEAVPGGVAAE